LRSKVVQRRHAAKTGKFKAGNTFVRDPQHRHARIFRARASMRQSNAGDWSFLDSVLGMGKDLGVYTVPGGDIVDDVAVFEALNGYSGWVVLEAEQDPKKAPALPYAQKGVAHIRAALEEADLK
jgi:inosose dehydratase